MKLTTFIPYSIEKNLGAEYNRLMAKLDPDEWAAFCDHDMMFLHPGWYQLICSAISLFPEGVFNVQANRIGNKYQRDHSAPAGDDIKEHREYASSQLGKLDVVELPWSQEWLMGGLCTIISKNTWTKIGGAPEKGILGIDNEIHRRCIAKGIKVYLIEGLYVYHWYRGGTGDKSHLK